MIRAVIFDCFGVLITDALQVVCDKHAATDPTGATDIKSIVTTANLGIISRKESNERVSTILGISVEEFRSRVDNGEVRNIELFDYILTLRKSHKTALLSNISPEGLNRRFSQDELAGYFDVVVTSGEVGFVKPSPEIYEIVADRLGLRYDECVFIDDRELFVDGAKSVGMQAFLYTDFQNFKTKLTSLLS